MHRETSPQTASPVSPDELPLWLRREAPAAGFLFLSAFTLYAVLFASSGLAADWAASVRAFAGEGGLPLSLVFAAFGAAKLRERFDGFRLTRVEVAGWLVALAAVLGLLAAIGDGARLPSASAGGWLGGTVWWVFRTLFGPTGGIAAIATLGLIALPLAFGVLSRRRPLRDLLRELPARIRAALRPKPRQLPAEPVVSRPVRPAVHAPEPAPISRPAPRPIGGEWFLPPADCLQEVIGGQISQVEIERKAEQIVQALADFDVSVRITAINPGPTVTQYGVEPGFRERRDKSGAIVRRDKVKVNEITSLANDLALALAAPSIRIEAPVPGRDYVGIEVPNQTTAVVNLHRIISSPQFQKLRAKAKLALALGENVSGEAVATDLAKMPHLLVAGQTGAGKSVCINSIIASLLLHATPDELRLILVDPKRVELTGYNDVPHLLRPVVVEADKVVSVLKWVVNEMESRYKLYEQIGVRNIDGYNKLCEKQPEINGELKRMHYIVVVIDELANLMMLAPAETERLICRLAQLARATGIHLIVATQRPSVDVITGLIKANFPTRISFAVASMVDSRTILDSGGAEKLLGRGDMLFLPQEAPKSIRVQGTFVSDDEIKSIVDWWKEQGAPDYVDELVNAPSYDPNADDETDDLWGKAVALAEDGRVSVSFLQRRLRIGHNRASRLIERLEEEGLVLSAEEAKMAREERRDLAHDAGPADEDGYDPDGNGPVVSYRLPPTP